jgi:hypothetical protein
MEIIIKGQLSGATVTREDESFFSLGPQNPETQEVWRNETEIRDFITKTASNPYVWQKSSDALPTESIISPATFKRRFFPEERVAIALIRAKRDSSDPVEAQAAILLDIFFEDLDDPRLVEMDLNSPNVETGLAFLVHLNVISQERADFLGAL